MSVIQDLQSRGLIAQTTDIEALDALLNEQKIAPIIFVINNNGGAIFDTLAVDPEVKNEFYRMPHNMEFSQIASTFDLKYARPYTWADLSSVLKQAYYRKETTLIEIKVGPNDGSNSPCPAGFRHD